VTPIAIRIVRAVVAIMRPGKAISFELPVRRMRPDAEWIVLLLRCGDRCLLPGTPDLVRVAAVVAFSLANVSIIAVDAKVLEQVSSAASQRHSVFDHLLQRRHLVRLAVVVRLRMTVLLLLAIRLLLGDNYVSERPDVLMRCVQERVRRLSVPTRPSAFLVESFDRLRKGEMNNVPYVRNVDAHSFA
jgi:hypothetical protein